MEYGDNNYESPHCDEENNEMLYEGFFETGAFVKIKWGKSEVKDSGWRPSWFIPQVQGHYIEDDRILVKYISEPDRLYDMEVTPE